MHGLALAIIIYFAVGGIWDILEPNAVRLKFNNPMRALVAACAQIAMIVLALLTLGVTAAGGLAIGAVLFALACLSAAVDNS